LCYFCKWPSGFPIGTLIKIIIIIVIIIIIIIIIRLLFTFIQSVYNYVPETNHVSRVHNIPAILWE